MFSNNVQREYVARCLVCGREFRGTSQALLAAEVSFHEQRHQRPDPLKPDKAVFPPDPLKPGQTARKRTRGRPQNF
jgi:hypothetical protein